MQAAVLESFGQPLTVCNVPDPVLGTGEVIVDVAATGLLHYMGEVFSGERQYALTLPVIPGLGAVGRVAATGPDATHLQPGDWVLCDPTIRSRDGGPTPDITLQGLSGRGEGGLRLQERFGNGALAQKLLIPTENAIPLGDISPVEAVPWCSMLLLLVPYGGLLAGGLQPGETIVVSGATGPYGGAAIAVALAMGAGTVLALGRNSTVLEELASRFGPRLRPVVLDPQEDGEATTKRIRAAAPGPIDLVFDILPPEAPARLVRTAAMSVREFGRVVLMGGVGMLGGEDLALPYPWLMRNSVTVQGRWMYGPEAPAGLVAMAKSGLLDLEQFAITEFPLEEVNEAIEHAAGDRAPFRLTVVRP